MILWPSRGLNMGPIGWKPGAIPTGLISPQNNNSATKIDNGRMATANTRGLTANYRCNEVLDSECENLDVKNRIFEFQKGKHC